MVVKKSEQLIFSALAGAVLMLVVCIGFDDFKMAAHATEKTLCRDEPDRVAYYARKPTENHNVERCVQVMRFSDPKWVPELGAPTIAGAGVKGRQGLEQQLGYVRAECKRLAKQLDRRC